MSPRAYYVGVPLFANILLAGIAVGFSSHFGGTAWLCYFVGGCALAAGSVSVGGFLLRDTTAVETLISVITHAVTMIVIFAAIYAGFGLTNFEAPVTLSTALYFSVVTWTTLGYGDFTPLAQLRVLAAMQAIAGYVLFGLIVGVTTNLISRLR